MLISKMLLTVDSTPKQRNLGNSNNQNVLLLILSCVAQLNWYGLCTCRSINFFCHDTLLVGIFCQEHSSWISFFFLGQLFIEVETNNFVWIQARWASGSLRYECAVLPALPIYFGIDFWNAMGKTRSNSRNVGNNSRVRMADSHLDNLAGFFNQKVETTITQLIYIYINCWKMKD